MYPLYFNSYKNPDFRGAAIGTKKWLRISFLIISALLVAVAIVVPTAVILMKNIDTTTTTTEITTTTTAKGIVLSTKEKSTDTCMTDKKEKNRSFSSRERQMTWPEKMSAKVRIYLEIHINYWKSI